ncbi:MAG: hypothetical protein IPO92_16450, partial [Saprospiraceae bacterium]|nr:hypothetical protein [Saprospiraceae bacterium]
KRKFDHFELKDNDLALNVRSIIHSNDGTLWCGSRDNGIGHFDASGNDLDHYNLTHKNAASNFVMEMVQLDNDMLGIGGNTIQKYNKKANTFESIPYQSNFGNHFFGNAVNINDKELFLIDYTNVGNIFMFQFKESSGFGISKIFVKGQKTGDEFLSMTKGADNEYFLDINATEIAYIFRQ